MSATITKATPLGLGVPRFKTPLNETTGEEIDVGESEIEVLKDISRTLRQQGEDIKYLRSGGNGNTKNVITAVVAVISVILVIAAYLTSVAGDKRALEINVQTLKDDNTKIWGIVETQRLRIDTLDKALDHINNMKGAR